jgi:hypothetical protein
LRPLLVALATVALLATPASGQTPTYPDAQDVLGKPTPKPSGKTATREVCKKGCAYKTIAKAVKQAKKGDTIRIAKGTYRESVRIAGAGKSHIKLIGDTKRPGRVILDGKSLKGGDAQNGVFINGADGVRVSGLTVRNYKANGIFVTNAIGYELSDLVARQTGTYGLYAFNSVGGVMEDSEASEVNDGAFYVGQTPVQDKPRRTFVRNVDGHTSVIGFTGTNMRYVTITGSRFYNNAVGVVPNALSSEKYPPATDNVISGNEIFWNNFNYYRGAPFPLRQTEAAGVPFPPGLGLLLLGGHRNVVENNKIYGNFLAGAGMVQGFALNETDAPMRNLESNRISGNEFGLGGTDLNGRDLVYDGNGTGNCWGPNTGVQVTVPADAAHFPGCPFAGANAYKEEVFNEVVGWALSEDHEAPWIRHPHAAKPGYTAIDGPAG